MTSGTGKGCKSQTYKGGGFRSMPPQSSSQPAFYQPHNHQNITTQMDSFSYLLNFIPASEVPSDNEDGGGVGNAYCIVAWMQTLPTYYHLWATNQPSLSERLGNRVDLLILIYRSLRFVFRCCIIMDRFSTGFLAEGKRRSGLAIMIKLYYNSL